MMQMEFLDVLYTWKVEAEQELEKLLEEKEQSEKELDELQHLKMLRDLKIKHAEEIVNRYRNTISSYIFHHR